MTRCCKICINYPTVLWGNCKFIVSKERDRETHTEMIIVFHFIKDSKFEREIIKSQLPQYICQAKSVQYFISYESL